MLFALVLGVATALRCAIGVSCTLEEGPCRQYLGALARETNVRAERVNERVLGPFTVTLFLLDACSYHYVCAVEEYFWSAS